jgi:phosphoribosylglycinamide formyltransferase-1
MDEAILYQCQLWQADLLILAGYMRLLSPVLIQAYPQHILNIHPSLLPKYKGKDALGQALSAKETTLGISIHYVDEGMDTGELVAQFPFTIESNEARSQLEAKLHQLEHAMYPRVIQQLIKEKI